MFNALVILGNPDTAPVLRSLIAATGIVTVMRELSAFPGNYELGRLLNTLGPDLVLIDLSAGQPAVNCAARIHDLSPHVPVVGIGCTTETRLTARMAGLASLVDLHASPEAIHLAIREALEKSQGGPQPFLFSFLPSKAGSGCSTVVLNTAVAAAALGRRVLVIDADLRSSVMALMLGLEPAGGTQAALASSAELDTFIVRRCSVQKHGADFLLSTRELDAQPPEWTHYYRLLSFVRPHYDLVFVDLPELVNPATVEVIRRSEKIFPVCTSELPSLKLTLQRLAELRRLGVEEARIEVLLNRLHPSAPPLAELEAVIGRPVSHAFPNNYRAVEAAIRAGAPVDPESALGQAFTAFAARLARVEPPARAPTLGQRLRGLLHLAPA